MRWFLVLRTMLRLKCSNVFMTYAWYSHLRNWSDKKWYIAAVLSWGIALFEYLLQVPANRAGYTTMSLAQLKVLQEVITLLVLSSIRFALHASAHQTQFSLGRSVPCRRSLFHVPSIKFR